MQKKVVIAVIFLAIKAYGMEQPQEPTLQSSTAGLIRTISIPRLNLSGDESKNGEMLSLPIVAGYVPKKSSSPKSSETSSPEEEGLELESSVYADLLGSKIVREYGRNNTDT